MTGEEALVWVASLFLEEEVQLKVIKSKQIRAMFRCSFVKVEGF